MAAHTQTNNPPLDARPRRQRMRLAEEVSEEIARELILNGTIGPGALLPSEKDLAVRMGVSRPTIRESLLVLQQAGLISVRHGVGSVVQPRSRTLTHGLDRLCSIETFAHEAGKAVESIEVEWEEVEADERTAERLQLSPGHRVLVSRRVKTYDGERVGWLVDYIPEGIMSFDEVRSRFAGSILDVLLSDAAVDLEHSDSDLTAVNLSEDIAARLHVEPGVAAFAMDSVMWSAGGRAVNLATSWYLPQYFRFAVRRRRQLGHRAAGER